MGLQRCITEQMGSVLSSYGLFLMDLPNLGRAFHSLSSPQSAPTHTAAKEGDLNTSKIIGNFVRIRHLSHAKS